MASAINWNDEYSVGVAEIDGQHKILFELYNELLAAYQAGGQSIVSHAFEEMASYLDVHFSAEEEFWQRDEKLYREHRKLHFDFVKYVLKETADGNNLEFFGSLLEFLAIWLCDHVQTVDKIQFQQLRDQGLL